MRGTPARMRINRSTRIIQLVSLGVFFVLLGFATYPLVLPVPPDLILRLDPLIALGTLLSAHRLPAVLLTSLVLVGATLWLGRFFCSHVCPLGTTLDLLDEGVTERFRKKTSLPEERRRRRLRWKYYVLAGVLLSSLTGSTFLFIFDPISLATRFYTLVVYPVVAAGIRGLLEVLRPLFAELGSGAAYASVGRARFALTLLTLGLLTALVVLQLWERRFWCRNLCPLGALLALIARLRLVRRHVAEDCTRCGLCQKACLGGALSEGGAGTLAGECFVCRTCEAVCPEGAVRFTHRAWGAGPAEEGPDVTRRGLVTAGVMGLVLGAMGGEALARPEPRRLIRPPGALPEKRFLATCVRCGECMKVCLTNTLQPCFLEAGWEGVWTPRLLCRHAGCEERCNVCGHVCPTRAIRPLSLEEKRYAKIGSAAIDRERCIAWERGKECLICDEACPYNAIDFRVVRDACGVGKRPFVIPEKCVGCGLCEEKCPVGGESAIVVYPDGEMRLETGSYITEEAVRMRQAEADSTRDYFTPVEGESECPVPAEPRPGDLPPGFVVEE